MAIRVIITNFLCGMALCVRQCLGGTTLYPIVDSNTSVPPVSAVRTNIGQTNNVPAHAGISVILKPTAIGPVGASGLAQIGGHFVQLHVSGLGPGRYDLQLVKRPDDIIEPLGTVMIVDPTLGPSRQASDNKKEASANPESVWIQTDVQMKLPSKVNARDVLRVLVAGPGGNAVLAGDAPIQSPVSKH